MHARALTWGAVLVLVGGATVGVDAWGPTGHRVVVRLALARLTPDAARLVRELLDGADPLDASTWADQVRNDRPETYNWHFVDIPFGARSYVPSRDCRPTDRGDCVIAAIDRARTVVADASRSRADRAEALKFLLHLVADVHQPLHDIDNHDRGGNDVPTLVDGYEPPPGRSPPNLHAVWDSVLIDQRGLDAAAYADALVSRLPSGGAPETIDVVAWALDAHALAERFAYAYPGFSRTGPPTAPVHLDRAYQRAAGAVVDRQLLRAGIRLAAVLNEAARRAASRRPLP